MSKLEQAAALAARVMAGLPHDVRPQMLRAMTDAAPTCTLYNIFMFELVKMLGPRLCVETGTDRGRAAAHMAMGSSHARVVSIDIDAACSAQLQAMAFPNAEAWTMQSVDAAARFEAGSIDLLFLDSLHERQYLQRELAAFMPKLSPGAIILLDDINLNADMNRAWNEITLPKRDVTPLHFTGFGIVQAP